MTDILGLAAARPECCVRHCLDEAGPVEWRTNTAVPCWSIGWAVCNFHYWQIDDGQEYASVSNGEASSQRWILMGDDLVIESLATPV